MAKHAWLMPLIACHLHIFEEYFDQIIISPKMLQKNLLIENNL
jgi:hypothetical protein